MNRVLSRHLANPFLYSLRSMENMQLFLGKPDTPNPHFKLALYDTTVFSKLLPKDQTYPWYWQITSRRNTTHSLPLVHTAVSTVRLKQTCCSRKYRVILNVCRCFNNLPPRSPDATPCDFFLWGYVKDQVYVPPLPACITELKVRFRTAIETITADMLQTVWNELDYRVDVCRITKGAHIEDL